jgi:hypothetical protein
MHTWCFASTITLYPPIPLKRGRSARAQTQAMAGITLTYFLPVPPTGVDSKIPNKVLKLPDNKLHAARPHFRLPLLGLNL